MEMSESMFDIEEPENVSEVETKVIPPPLVLTPLETKLANHFAKCLMNILTHKKSAVFCSLPDKLSEKFTEILDSDDSLSDLFRERLTTLLENDTLMLDEIMQFIESRHLKLHNFEELQYVLTKACVLRNNQLFQVFDDFREF